jgi:hypothetical protein
MLESKIRKNTKSPVWRRADKGQEWPQNTKGCEQEGAWSLPIIPILLVAILALVYFFGWKVLLILLAAVVAISLGTFLYDRIPRRGPESTHFWFHSDQDLHTLWELLVGTERYSDDAENVWEWIGAQARVGEHQYHISISRKHNDSTYLIHITVTYQKKQLSPEMREDLGRRFATALEMDVKTGDIEYLDGNRFEFKEEKTFTPEARR